MHMCILLAESKQRDYARITYACAEPMHRIILRACEHVNSNLVYVFMIVYSQHLWYANYNFLLFILLLSRALGKYLRINEKVFAAMKITTQLQVRSDVH